MRPAGPEAARNLRERPGENESPVRFVNPRPPDLPSQPAIRGTSLKEAIARSGKTGDCLAIVLIDLDYFKEINDQFGHAVGDQALKEFSRSLPKAIRACDMPIRARRR
jgi:predicted signal transduction protein with EAL and GGDEF domain